MVLMVCGIISGCLSPWVMAWIYLENELANAQVLLAPTQFGIQYTKRRYKFVSRKRLCAYYLHNFRLTRRTLEPILITEPLIMTSMAENKLTLVPRGVGHLCRGLSLCDGEGWTEITGTKK